MTTEQVRGSSQTRERDSASQIQATLKHVRSQTVNVDSPRGRRELLKSSVALVGKDVFTGQSRVLLVSPQISSNSQEGLGTALRNLTSLGLRAIHSASQAGKVGFEEADKLRQEMSLGGVGILSRIQKAPSPTRSQPAIERSTARQASFDSKPLVGRFIDSVKDLTPSQIRRLGIVTISNIALAGCSVISPAPVPNFEPTTVGASETETVPIEMTPVIAPTNVAPELIANNITKPLPPNINGNMELSSVPQGSIAFTESENLDLGQSLHNKGLLEVVSDGVLSYLGKDGKAYVPVIGEITDPETGKILTPTGPADKNGVVKYQSEDRSITQYSLIAIKCEANQACLQIVSFNPEDPGVTYNIKVDLKTGKIISYMPAISSVMPSGEKFKPAEESRWQTPLSGQAALSQVESLLGISYGPNPETGENNFIFSSGNKRIAATDEEILWQSDFGLTIGVTNESGQKENYIWNETSKEWTKATLYNSNELTDGAQIYQAGDKKFIEIEGNKIYILNLTRGNDEKSLAIGSDGSTFVWSESSWENILPNNQLRETQARLGSEYLIGKSAEGDYYVINGNEKIKIFADGSTEMDIDGETLVTGLQSITLDSEKNLIWGLWDDKDGDGIWTPETYPAPKSSEETENWRSLTVIRGHKREEEMSLTIFEASRLAANNETHNPISAELQGIKLEYNFKTYEDFDVTPKRWEINNWSRNRNGEIRFLPINSGEVPYGDDTNTANGRPMQISIDSGAWFWVDVVDKNTNSTFRVSHVPIVAMNSNGEVILLSSLIPQEDLFNITHLLSRTDRGKLSFKLHTQQIKDDSVTLLNEDLTRYIVDVNKKYVDLVGIPRLGDGVNVADETWKLGNLPIELSNSFLTTLLRNP